MKYPNACTIIQLVIDECVLTHTSQVKVLKIAVCKHNPKIRHCLATPLIEFQFDFALRARRINKEYYNHRSQ